MRHWHAVPALLLISSATLVGCSKHLSAGDAASDPGAGSSGMRTGTLSTDGALVGGGARHLAGVGPGVHAAGAGPGGTTYSGAAAGTRISAGAGGGLQGAGSALGDGSTVHGEDGGAGAAVAASGAGGNAAAGSVGGDGTAAGDSASKAGGIAADAASGAGGGTASAAGGAGSVAGMDRAGQGGASGGADGVAAGAGEESSGGATAGAASAGAHRSALAGFHSAAQLADIHFDYDAYAIRAGEAAALEANAQWLRSNPGHVVLIEGHCDERGTQEYNLALGAHRAKATMTYLVSQGVAAERIRLISYGKERPVCTEPADSCWARNRRAHFMVKAE